MRHLLPLCTLLISGCAVAVPLGNDSPEALGGASGTGDASVNEIIVYRTAQAGFVVNVAATPAILVDGRSVGTCGFARPIVIKVPEGEWTIAAVSQSGDVQQSLTVAGGERRYLRCGTSHGPTLSPAPTLVPVDATTGKVEAGL